MKALVLTQANHFEHADTPSDRTIDSQAAVPLVG